MERKAAQQNKNLSEELKQGLPRIAQVSNAGGIANAYLPPSHRMCPPAPKMFLLTPRLPLQ